MSKYFKWLVPLLFAFAIWLPIPVFAEADVSNPGVTEVLTSTDKITVVHKDFVGSDGKGDVGSPLGNAGWDFQILTATVDVDFNLNIFAKAECRVGDADCDGNPVGTSKGLSDLSGVDIDFFDNNSTESYVFGVGREKLDYVCGVSAERQDNVLRCAPAKPGSVWYEPQFGFPLDTQVPWLYSVGVLSDTAYVKFNLKSAYQTMPSQIRIVAYSGSQQDAGVGEDYIPNTITSGGAITVPVPSLIGDRIWNDVNADGVQDQSEQGVDGWQVQLQTCNGQQIEQAVTDANGNYQFLVPSGKYQIKFDTVASWKISSSNQGDDDAVDSDADQTGLTPCLTLMPGESNMTIDMGLWQPASIGDRCWEDRDNDGLQGDSEPSVEGCEIQMRKPDGSVEQTLLTDANGFYTFETTSGTHCLFAEAPDGSEYTSFTFPSMGSSDIDSNVERMTGRLGCYNLLPGQNRDDVDLGLQLPPADPHIRVKQVTPTTVQQGGHLTYTVIGGNNGPGIAFNAVVTDTIPASLTLVMPLPLGCNFDQPDMVCYLGDLEAGEFFTLTYEAIAPTGLVSDTLLTNQVEIRSNSRNTDQGNDIKDSDVLITINEAPTPITNHPCYLPIVQTPPGATPPKDPCEGKRALRVKVVSEKPEDWVQDEEGNWQAIGMYTVTTYLTLTNTIVPKIPDVSFVHGYRTCLWVLDPIPFYAKIYGEADDYKPVTTNPLCYNPNSGDAADIKSFDVNWGDGDLSHFTGEGCQFTAAILINVDPPLVVQLLIQIVRNALQR